jgi:hypothetical protein
VGPLPGAMVIDGTSNGSKLFRPTSLNGLVSCPTASSTACAKHSPKSLRFRLHFLKLEAKRSCRQRPKKLGQLTELGRSGETSQKKQPEEDHKVVHCTTKRRLLAKTASCRFM